MAWETSVSVTLNADEPGNAGWTMRQQIPAASISNTGGTQVRVTFKGGNSEGFGIINAYIGQKADSGDAYDFQTTPVQLKFGGANGIFITGGTTQISDAANFSIPAGKDIIVSFAITDRADDTPRINSSATGFTRWQKAGSDAATVNATGYSNNTNYCIGVTLIESLIVEAGGVLQPLKMLTGVGH